MYLEHFGLSVNPFSLSPKLDFLYQSETFAESMAHLVYGLDSQEAIVLVTGPIGTGKTMALQSFLSSLGPHYESALVTNTRVGSLELLKLMLEDLNVNFPLGVDKSDLLILFKNFLRESSRQGKTVLLIVDEAQNLAPEVLEELRLLTNLGQGDTQPVQIILVGQPELEDLVDRPDMAQIRQRIRVHYRLAPLNRVETEEYLAHRMRVAGCERAAFSKGAVDKIYQLSGGVPRVVNSYAGDALLSAFVAGCDVVRKADVGDDDIKGRGTEPDPVLPPIGPAGVTQEAVAPVGLAKSVANPRKPAPTVMATRAERGHSKAWAVLVSIVILAALATGVFYYWDSLQGLIPFPAQQAQTSAAETKPQITAEPPAVLPEVKSEPVVVPPTTPDEAPAKVVQEKAGLAATTTVVGTVEPYYIHVASFRSSDRAENFASHWQQANESALMRAEFVKGATWNRVYVGPFSSHAEALAEANRLEREGVISYYAVKLLPAPDSGR